MFKRNLTPNERIAVAECNESGEVFVHGVLYRSVKELYDHLQGELKEIYARMEYERELFQGLLKEGFQEVFDNPVEGDRMEINCGEMMYCLVIVDISK